MMRQALEKDIHKIEAFLLKAELSIEGVRDLYDHFLITEDKSGDLIGVIGIEPIKPFGLLRSLAFSPKFPIKQLPELLEGVIQLARNKQLRAVYLATDKLNSIPLFEMLGFKKVHVDHLPAEMKLSTHGSHLMGITNCIFLCKTL